MTVKIIYWNKIFNNFVALSDNKIYLILKEIGLLSPCDFFFEVGESGLFEVLRIRLFNVGGRSMFPLVDFSSTSVCS